ncbi:MAG TPA: RING finger protein [Solirubrobacteraceae bacterium]
MQTPGGPVHGLATQAETGRACPYCRFPLKEGTEMVRCGVCSAPHHADCWTDNGNGCAVVACQGGPTADTRAAAAAPTQVTPAPPAPNWAPQHQQQPVAAAPPPPPQPPQPAWAQQQPAPSSGGRTGPWVLAAAVVLAIALGGAALAVVSSQKDGTPTTTVQTAAQTESIDTDGATSSSEDGVQPDDATEDTSEDFPEDTSSVPAEASSALPDESEAQMQDEIQTMLRDWHESLTAGDYRTAFDAMTQRKQDKALRTNGYDAWASGQKSLGDYIDPSGLKARIVEANSRTGVVTVRVSNMGYSNPESSCSTWGGITWVRWEDGEWKYDPGYSTTPQRTREWRPRQSELMGIGC